MGMLINNVHPYLCDGRIRNVLRLYLEKSQQSSPKVARDIHWTGLWRCQPLYEVAVLHIS